MAAARPLVSRPVLAALLELLLSDVYGPGERLPPQRALAADLGVTMTALREGLARVEQMGLVEVRHGNGMRVRDWRAHGGLDVLPHLLVRAGGLDAGVLRDVFEARRLTLELMAGLAAKRRSDAQAAELARLAAAIAANADPEAGRELDFAFFTTLAEASGNLVFVLLLGAIRGLYFEHAELLAVTAAPEPLAAHYADAAVAVARGDGDAARGAIERLAQGQAARVAGALGDA